VSKSADHGGRCERRLADHQLGGRGDLVGDGWGGDLQDRAVGVGLAGQVHQGGQPGAADRDVGLALTPGPAGGVGHDDSDASPGDLAESLA
jgi:hypothetical protein